MTAAAGDQLLLRLHGPQKAGFRVRTPALLPHLISLKGERVRKSAAYKVKGAGLQQADRLLLKKKKKK